MLRYEFFKLNFAGVLIRYYLLMTVVIIGGFSGQWWIALLAIPIFVSTIMGIKISLKPAPLVAKENTGKIINLSVMERKEVG